MVSDPVAGAVSSWLWKLDLIDDGSWTVELKELLQIGEKQEQEKKE